eukprot:COSAG06_NODE_3842_length_4845_cov_79.461863_3_plen_54_part_00
MRGRSGVFGGKFERDEAFTGHRLPPPPAPFQDSFKRPIELAPTQQCPTALSCN